MSLPPPATVPGEIAEGVAPASSQCGYGRFLGVDDEPSIKTVCAAMLRQLVYDPKTAAGGAEAVEMVRSSLASEVAFDLIIMDLTMPGDMGGKQATKQILEIDPQSCVVVSSGYSTDPLMANFAEYGFMGFVVKPYRLEELSNAVNGALSRARDRCC